MRTGPLVLALLGFYFEIANTIYSGHSITANIGTGFDTKMDAGSFYPTYYAGATGSTYVLQLTQTQPAAGSGGGPVVYLFNPSKLPYQPAIRLKGVLNAEGLTAVRSAQMMENKQVIAAGGTGENRLQVITTTYNTGTGVYSGTSWAFMATIIQAARLKSDGLRSNYIFYTLGFSQPFKVRRWDYTTTNPDPTMLTGYTDQSHSMTFYDDEVLVYGQSGTEMLFVNRASFQATMVLTGTTKSRYFNLDNQDNKVIFATLQDTPFGVARLALGTSTYTVTHTIPGQGGRDYTHIMNMASHSYVALVRWRTSGQPMKLYQKSDLLEASASLFTPFSTTTKDDMMVIGPSFENDFTFSIQVENPTGVYNFQEWYVNAEVCTSRVASICSGCPPQFYLNTFGVPDNQCYGLGWGKILSTQSLTRCTDAFCLYCAADNTKCTRCDPQSAKPYLSESRCVDLAGIPSRFGVNLVDYTVVGCSDSNCLNCASDATVCTACEPSAEYTAISGVCIPVEVPQPPSPPVVSPSTPTSKLRILEEMFDPRTASARIIFDKQISVQSAGSQPLNITMRDLVENRVYSCQDLGCTINAQENGLSIVFNTTKVILKGEITIHRTPGVEITRTEDGQAFADYPILVQQSNIYLMRDSAIGSVMQTSSQVNRALPMSISTVIGFVVPNLAPLLDEIVTSINIYALFSSPAITYFDHAVLLGRNSTLLPFPVPNPFVEMNKDNLCSPEDMFARYDYNCAFLDNTGTDILMIGGLVAFVLLVKFVIYRWITLSKDPNPSMTKRVLVSVLTFIDWNWGMMMIVARIEGNMLGYLTYAFLDLKHSSMAGIPLLNSSFAALTLMYHGLVSFVVYLVFQHLSQHHDLKSQCFGRQRVWTVKSSSQPPESPTLLPSTNRSSEIQTGRKEPDLLQAEPGTEKVGEDNLEPKNKGGHVDVNSLAGTFKFPWRFLFSNIRVPSKRLNLMTPLIKMLKYFGISLLVNFRADKPQTQCLLGLLFEIVYFLYTSSKVSFQAEFVERTAQTLLQLLIIALLICKYISHFVDEVVLQTQLAVVMVVVLMSMLLLSVVVGCFALFAAGKQIIRGGPSTIRLQRKNSSMSGPAGRESAIKDRQEPKSPALKHTNTQALTVGLRSLTTKKMDAGPQKLLSKPSMPISSQKVMRPLKSISQLSRKAI